MVVAVPHRRLHERHGHVSRIANEVNVAETLAEIEVQKVVVLGHAHGLAHPRALVVLGRRRVVHVIEDGNEGEGVTCVFREDVFRLGQPLEERVELGRRVARAELAVELDREHVLVRPADLVALHESQHVINKDAQVFRFG